MTLLQKVNRSVVSVTDEPQFWGVSLTQQHIHDYLIEKAKEKLAATTLSVSEIAYALGFEHPQSFSKLFKSKTDVSPLEFRARFN